MGKLYQSPIDQVTVDRFKQNWFLRTTAGRSLDLDQESLVDEHYPSRNQVSDDVLLF